MPKSTESSAPQHVYLIDGSGFIFRAFHGVRPLTRPDGTPVNAVYGFTQMLMKILTDTDAGLPCRDFRRGAQDLPQRYISRV